MKKIVLNNHQLETMSNLASSIIAVIEHYRTTDDLDRLQEEINDVVVNLAVARYVLPKTVLEDICAFVDTCLKTLPELKLFAQYSTETILLYRDGPVEQHVAEADAQDFAEYICTSNLYFAEPKKSDSQMCIKYSETFKQAVADYYICFMCNEPEKLSEITDRQAYEIISGKLYEFIDQLFGTLLCQ